MCPKTSEQINDEVLRHGSQLHNSRFLRSNLWWNRRRSVVHQWPKPINIKCHSSDLPSSECGHGRTTDHPRQHCPTQQMCSKGLSHDRPPGLAMSAIVAKATVNQPDSALHGEEINDPPCSPFSCRDSGGWISSFRRQQAQGHRQGRQPCAS